MLKIYIDGKLDGQRDINANKIGTNDQPFCIGGNAGNSNRWFDGMIDEVIVYNRALTEAEIKKDMEGLSVDLGHKTAVTWGSIKRQY